MTTQAASSATGTLEKTLRLLAGIVVTTAVVLGMTVHEYWLYLALFAGLNLLQSGNEVGTVWQDRSVPGDDAAATGRTAVS